MADPAWLPAVRAEFDKYGIPPEVWVPILLHESNGNPNAENNTTGKPLSSFKPGILPEWSVGLFQINVQAKAVKSDGTRVMTVDDEAKLAQSLKDPATNARYAAAAMAPAWNLVKGLNLTPPEWSGAVGTMSGWPAGSIANPCNTDYCNQIKQQFAGVFSVWANAINLGPNFEAGADLLSPYWKGSKTGSAASNTTGAGQSAYNSVTTAPGYPPAGSAGTPSQTATGQGSGAGSPGSTGSANSGIATPNPITDPGGWAAAALQGGEDQAKARFTAWLASDGAKTLLMFWAGMVIFLFAIAAILWEKAGPTVVKVAKGTVEGSAASAAAA